MAKKKFIVRHLGLAKPDDPMFQRGYLINPAPNAVNKAATEKPAAAPEPPTKPKRKKKPGKK